MSYATTTKAQIPVYRPSLTATEIEAILNALAKNQAEWTLADRGAYSKLQVFYFKIKAELKIPASINSQVSISSALMTAFSTSENPVIDRRIARTEAYIKWQVSPAACTASELEMVQVHRAESGLMSEEEFKAYEKQLIDGI